MPKCNEIIPSEDYADFILESVRKRDDIQRIYADYCPQFTDYRYLTLYAQLSLSQPMTVENHSYGAIPKLYGLMDTTAVEATGAIRLQNQTGFELTGKDVIVGFIDTGIDYTNPLFKTTTGQTRIVGMWDQTDQTGPPPNGFLYGREYRREDIDAALSQTNPELIVREKDEVGHGTFMAGVACGTYDEQQDFIGAAPESQIAVVKLKPAKQYLKDYFLISTDEPVFQENDIMLGVTYLRDLSLQLERPLVIVLGVGTGSGDRSGGSPLGQQLNNVGQIIGSCIVACSGNEGNSRLHYSGNIEEDEVENVEIKVGENNPGFVMELWGNPPDVFSVAFTSPLGETVPRIPAGVGTSDTLNFVFEDTTIDIDYSLVESGTGGELIFMRFVKPTPGLWTIKVYGSNILTGGFNIWGNLSQFTSRDTYFLRPDPEKTLTIPASVDNVITVGGYNHTTGAIYPQSGRGFTREEIIKPDIVAPSVNVSGPGLRNDFVRKSGTSVGAALTAGCCAQMLQWGIVQQKEPYMKTNYIKNYFIRGATRDRDIVYPSSQWGFGKINVFNSFSILTRT